MKCFCFCLEKSEKVGFSGSNSFFAFSVSIWLRLERNFALGFLSFNCHPFFCADVLQSRASGIFSHYRDSLRTRSGETDELGWRERWYCTTRSGRRPRYQGETFPACEEKACNWLGCWWCCWIRQGVNQTLYFLANLFIFFSRFNF